MGSAGVPACPPDTEPRRGTAAPSSDERAHALAILDILLGTRPERTPLSPAPSDAVIGATTARQVVFVGPMGVGKTTAVTALSDVSVAGTDVRRSTLAFTEPAQDGKTTTTVGIDYGEWTDPEGRRIALLGTPGQVRFSSARDSVTARRARLVLWVFGQRPDAAFEIGRWLELLGDESVWGRTVASLALTPGSAA